MTLLVNSTARKPELYSQLLMRMWWRWRQWRWRRWECLTACLYKLKCLDTLHCVWVFFSNFKRIFVASAHFSAEFFPLSTSSAIYLLLLCINSLPWNWLKWWSRVWGTCVLKPVEGRRVLEICLEVRVASPAIFSSRDTRLKDNHMQILLSVDGKWRFTCSAGS